MSETEIRERLARIEALLEGMVKRLDGDEKHRTKCYERLDELETYVENQKGANNALDKALGKTASIVVIGNIIVLLFLKIVFHF